MRLRKMPRSHAVSTPQPVLSQCTGGGGGELWNGNWEWKQATTVQRTKEGLV